MGVEGCTLGRSIWSLNASIAVPYRGIMKYCFVVVLAAIILCLVFPPKVKVGIAYFYKAISIMRWLKKEKDLLLSKYRTKGGMIYVSERNFFG